ncbi:hypothetical protein GCM10023205_39920 [Yinghuangia aomiensis]|uniref:YcxB-like protein n=1 Tax=Yinghuangia aomiensis TaxID=676205 RepID=A0ABP9HGX0_9ACTN
MMITARYTHTWRTALGAAGLAFVATPMAALPAGVVLCAVARFFTDWGMSLTTFVGICLTLVFAVVFLARTMVRSGELHVVMDDTGYTCEQAGKMTGTVTWATMKSVFRACGFVMFRMPGGGIAAVPESAYSPAQLAEIDAFIRARKTPQQA